MARDPSETVRVRDLKALQDEFNAGQNAILKFMESQYPRRQEVLDTINAATLRHIARRHTPWYRRFLAWVFRPFEALATAEQPTAAELEPPPLEEQPTPAETAPPEERPSLALVPDPEPPIEAPALPAGARRKVSEEELEAAQLAVELENGVKYRDKRAPRGVD